MTNREAYENMCDELEQYQEIGTVEECKELASIVNMAEKEELAKIIDEWLLYSKIGTVEECREAMSRYREREKLVKCEECLFLEERKLGKNGAISGICRIKPQNGRRYGKSRACKFFEKDYENSEGMEDENT